ncbi:hypothetical protein DXG03_000555 [Asterophora parasitica]|uniref:Uncharacterized protein n=1 Tax=Asterophora parasitica TaxID=117018 RepID=A0A9P7GAD0_9AGAR|nr:hypothetical protein DXG03_000555 [Asterophora parasitica]
MNSFLADPRRTKRTVQYRDPEDVWKYIGGGKRLATDLARQQRVLANVALIEARDREERLQMLRLEATPANSTSNHRSEPLTALDENQSPPESKEPQRQKTQATAGTSPTSDSSSPLPKMPGSDTNEPESWTPRARRRGQ